MDYAAGRLKRGSWMVRWAVISSLLLISAQALAQTDVEGRVQRILGQMTLEEKIDMLGGVDSFFVRELPRLGLPRLKMADGPLGVRNYGPATTMAGGIALAATWNPELAERVGTEIGRDARPRAFIFCWDRESTFTAPP